MPAKSKAAAATAPEEATASAVPAQMISIFNMVQQPHPPMKKAIGLMNKFSAKTEVSFFSLFLFPFYLFSSSLLNRLLFLICASHVLGGGGWVRDFS